MKRLAKELLNSEVAVFKKTSSTAPSEIRSIEQITNDIRNGLHQSRVERLRSLNGDKKAQEKLKHTMVCIGPSGLFKKRKLYSHIGIIQLDWDNVQNPEEHKQSVFQDEHVLLASISPRGNGVKALAAINPEHHYPAKDELISYFNRAYPFVKLDQSPMAPNSLMIVPWDPDILVKNDNAQIKVFMGATAQDSVVDTVTDIKTQRKAIDFSETENYAYAGDLKLPFSLAKNRLMLLPICRKRKEEFINQNPDLKSIWEIHIERGLEVDFSKRNDTLVNLVTRCFFRLGREQVLHLAGAFHTIYNPFFKDSYSQHMREAQAMLETMQESYLNDSPNEQSLYRSLESELQDIYRICRDLAINENKIESPFFALSGSELGKRLGLTRSVGAESLKSFSSIGIISLAKKGEAWATGKTAKANLWKWCLPLNEKKENCHQAATMQLAID